MADKRITELTNEKLILGDGDYTIVDSNEGTYKYKLKRIVDAIPAIDDSLSHEGQSADAKATGDEIADVKRDLNDKANTDGTYDGMTVGNAKQLLSEKYLLDEEPYLFRASGGDGSDRVEECIVGGSVVWNQLAYSIREGSLNRASARTGSILTKGRKALANHVYLLEMTITADTSDAGLMTQFFNVPLGSRSFAGVGRKSVVVKNGSTDGSPDYIYIFLGMNEGSGAEISYKDVNLFDLTALFGSTIADYIYSLEQATAGAGVAWFRKYFPEDYYPYSAPTLRHVEGVSQKEVVGWNQWDEEWEVGVLDTSTGQLIAGDRVASKNYIPVIPNTNYYRTNGAWFFYYDNDKNLISYGQANESGVIQTPNNCHYIKFYTGSSYGSIYNHDICINISDPAKNGQYEPYHKNIYPLDSSLTLRGVPKLADGKMYFDGDKYNADGTVQRRYGIVDLGTLNWGKSNTSFQTTSLNGLIKPPSSNAVAPEILLSKENYKPKSSNADSGVSGSYDFMVASSGQITYRYPQDGIADGSAFATLMSGTYMVYPLKTPTTETADPYTALQTLDPNGTEEFVSTGIVPVGHYSKYLENLRSKIEGLPRDFSTLIAPTEKEYKATRNYTVGSLLIVDNILYKVTSAIANGGTITPNTNVTATTLAAVIAAL